MTTAYDRPFDLVLVRESDGQPALPGRSADVDAPSRVNGWAEAVRAGGGSGYDVRVLLDGDDRDRPLFAALADRLNRDVLVAPPGGLLGPHSGDPIPRVAGVAADWIVVQPPRFTTREPGWFALHDGRIRPRTGPARLTGPGVVAFIDRDDFVMLRADLAGWLDSGPALDDGGLFVTVPVRAGRFAVTDYSGHTVRASGTGLAAALADRWLYGIGLHLGLTWPDDAAEQVLLSDALAELADVTGATVWTPPTGGATTVTAEGPVVHDRHGRPARWQLRTRAGAPHDGPSDRVVPAAHARPVRRPPVWSRPRRPDAADPPDRFDPDPLDLWLVSPWPLDRVVREGLPVASLHVPASIDPVGSGSRLRLHVASGGAVADPAPGPAGRYLIPVEKLDRTRLADTGLPLTVRSSGASHGLDGVPDGLPRWPRSTATAYAVVPDPSQRSDVRPIHRTRPTVTGPGRLLKLRVPAERALDLAAAAARLAAAPLLRTRVPELVAAGDTLVVPPAAWPEVTVVAEFADGAWHTPSSETFGR